MQMRLLHGTRRGGVKLTVELLALSFLAKEAHTDPRTSLTVASESAARDLSRGKTPHPLSKRLEFWYEKH